MEATESKVRLEAARERIAYLNGKLPYRGLREQTEAAYAEFRSAYEARLIASRAKLEAHGEMIAGEPHSEDCRCICTDGKAALRDVSEMCNSRRIAVLEGE